jgi:hypothetical protein
LPVLVWSPPQRPIFEANRRQPEIRRPVLRLESPLDQPLIAGAPLAFVPVRFPGEENTDRSPVRQASNFYT